MASDQTYAQNRKSAGDSGDGIFQRGELSWRDLPAGQGGFWQNFLIGKICQDILGNPPI
jgi:hypothetical protein